MICAYFFPKISNDHNRATDCSLQKQNTEISKQMFQEKVYRALSPNFHIHASVSDWYTTTIVLPILLQEICRPLLGLLIADRHMNVEIGAEAALFPEKEYINGIFLEVLFVSLIYDFPKDRGLDLIYDSPRFSRIRQYDIRYSDGPIAEKTTIR